MATEQDVKDVLLDMLGEEKKVKTNKIPRNVDASYKVALGLNLKELAISVIPPVIFMAIGFIAIALMNLLTIFMGFTVFITGLVIFLTIYALLALRPIPSKENIRMIDHVKQQQNFTKRQKVFFYGRKKEGVDDV